MNLLYFSTRKYRFSKSEKCLFHRNEVCNCFVNRWTIVYRLDENKREQTSQSLANNEQLIRPLADTGQYERKSTIEKDFKGYIFIG